MMIISSLSEECYIHDARRPKRKEELVWLHGYFFFQHQSSSLYFMFLYRHRASVGSSGENTHRCLLSSCMFDDHVCEASTFLADWHDVFFYEKHFGKHACKQYISIFVFIAYFHLFLSDWSYISYIFYPYVIYFMN